MNAAAGQPEHAPPPLAVVTCAVLETEIAHYAQDLPHVRHIELLEQGLHNDPPRLRTELQRAIERIEADHPDIAAIVLGYGLCSRGTEGVRTSRCRLIMARAHDCITLLLGSKERYEQYVREHPGTYWYSPGWNRHHTPPGQQRYEENLRRYVAQFGPDDAQYLMEMEQHWFTTYDRATYVDLTIGATEADLKYTRACAAWLKWQFDHQHGDPQLLRDLLCGPWDDQRFIVVPPARTFRMTADQRIVELDGA